MYNIKIQTKKTGIKKKDVHSIAPYWANLSILNLEIGKEIVRVLKYLLREERFV